MITIIIGNLHLSGTGSRPERFVPWFQSLWRTQLRKQTNSTCGTLSIGTVCGRGRHELHTAPAPTVKLAVGTTDASNAAIMLDTRANLVTSSLSLNFGQMVRQSLRLSSGVQHRWTSIMRAALLSLRLLLSSTIALHCTAQEGCDMPITQTTKRTR